MFCFILCLFALSCVFVLIHFLSPLLSCYWCDCVLIILMFCLPLWFVHAFISLGVASSILLVSSQSHYSKPCSCFLFPVLCSSFILSRIICFMFIFDCSLKRPTRWPLAQRPKCHSKTQQLPKAHFHAKHRGWSHTPCWSWHGIIPDPVARIPCPWLWLL